MVDKFSKKNSSSDVADMDLDPVVDALSKNRPDPQKEGGEVFERQDLIEDPGIEPSGLEKVAAKFTEKKIRNMIKAPYELAYVLTGVKEVRITDDEINLILEDAVDVMNELVKINPIWLAVFGVVVNGGAITWSKINAYKAEIQRRKNEKAKQP